MCFSSAMLGSGGWRCAVAPKNPIVSQRFGIKPSLLRFASCDSLFRKHHDSVGEVGRAPLQLDIRQMAAHAVGGVALLDEVRAAEAEVVTEHKRQIPKRSNRWGSLCACFEK